MKTKKNKVYVNKLFGNLILKNIVPIAIIFLITIALSFFYNNNIKSKEFYYSIKIFSNNDSILSSSVLSEVKNNLRESKKIRIIIMKYLSSFQNIEDKEIKTDDLGNYFLTFKSNKELEVNDFMEFLNKNHREILLENFQKEIIKLKKKIEISNIQNDKRKKELLELFEKLELIEFKKEIGGIDSPNASFSYMNNLMINSSSNNLSNNLQIETNLKLIEFYTKNFSTLFIEEFYFSLNGWQIKNNIYNNT